LPVGLSGSSCRCLHSRCSGMYLTALMRSPRTELQITARTLPPCQMKFFGCVLSFSSRISSLRIVRLRRAPIINRLVQCRLLGISKSAQSEISGDARSGKLGRIQSLPKIWRTIFQVERKVNIFFNPKFRKLLYLVSDERSLANDPIWPSEYVSKYFLPFSGSQIGIA